MECDYRFKYIRALGGEKYQQFLDAGYKEFYVNTNIQDTPYLLQKCIRNGNRVKLYFIDIIVHDLLKHSRIGTLVTYQAEVYLKFQKSEASPGPRDIRVLIHDDDETLNPEVIEAFCQRLYTEMGCVPCDED